MSRDWIRHVLESSLERKREILKARRGLVWGMGMYPPLTPGGVPLRPPMVREGDSAGGALGTAVTEADVIFEEMYYDMGILGLLPVS